MRLEQFIKNLRGKSKSIGKRTRRRFQKQFWFFFPCVNRLRTRHNESFSFWLEAISCRKREKRNEVNGTDWQFVTVSSTSSSSTSSSSVSSASTSVEHDSPVHKHARNETDYNIDRSSFSFDCDRSIGEFSRKRKKKELHVKLIYRPMSRIRWKNRIKQIESNKRTRLFHLLSPWRKRWW